MHFLHVYFMQPQYFFFLSADENSNIDIGAIYISIIIIIIQSTPG